MKSKGLQLISIQPKENAELKRLVDDRRKEQKLRVRVGGTGITRQSIEEVDNVIHSLYQIDFIDASITSLRTDAQFVPVDWDDYDDYEIGDDDYEDGDSFGEGGDLDDFGYYDPMEEFERNWIS